MQIILEPPEEIKKELGLQNGGPVHSFFTDECVRYMDPFVPFREGYLAETVIKDNVINRDNVSSDTIIYKQDYAEYVYEGISKSGNPLNYTKDKHPNAGPYWDQMMWNIYQDEIVNSVQKFTERGNY